MKALERLLIRFAHCLCSLLDVTPESLERIRRKHAPVPREEDRPDTFLA